MPFLMDKTLAVYFFENADVLLAFYTCGSSFKPDTNYHLYHHFVALSCNNYPEGCVWYRREVVKREIGKGEWEERKK